MLEKVRKIKVLESISGIFEKDEILYEFFDRPGHFYKDCQIEESFNLNTLKNFSPFQEWFEELKPVKKENTPQYKLISTK